MSAAPQITLNESVVPAHGLADVAASLAFQEWDDGPYADALTALVAAVDGAVRERRPESARAVRGLNAGYEFEAGVRFGFALAMTSQEGHGWGAAWLRAAHAWLERTGCSVALHEANAVAHLTRELAKVNEEARA